MSTGAADPRYADPIDATAAAALLRVLANPSRLRIVLCLLQGERSVAQIETALGLRQPKLSQQLGELREAGLVATRRESKSVFYRLAGETQLRLVSAVLQGCGGAPPATAASAGASAPGNARPMAAEPSSLPPPAGGARQPPASVRPRQAAVFAIVGDHT